MDENQDFEINEELTAAFLEHKQWEMDLIKRFHENGDSIFRSDDDEHNRFYGTEVNEEVIERLRRANKELDIINVLDDVDIDKFSEPHPRCRSGTVAVTITSTSFVRGLPYQALRRLFNLSDSLCMFPREEGGVRLVFEFNDIWKEHRIMSLEELEKEHESYQVDLEDLLEEDEEDD